ncbi:MAG: GAF domain-containing protein [Chloroflexi bacterium]|nr:GAF domain-containing protein [Chloroflexota bacterium]
MAIIYKVVPLVVFLICMFLTGLVLRSDWRSFRHRIFAVFLFVMGLWGFTIFGMRSSPNLNYAYQWERWVLVVIPFVGILCYHSTYFITNHRTNRLVVLCAYGAGIALAVLSLSDLVATGMQLKFYGYAPIPGPAFPVYLVVTWLPPVAALLLLARARSQSRSRDEKNRMEYFMLGVGMALVGGTTDALPPLGLRTYPMGAIFSIFFGVFTTIAIVRYQLMDLRVVLRKGLAYFCVSTVVFTVYGVTFLVLWHLFRESTSGGSVAVMATVAGLLPVSILLPPAISRIQSQVDRIFLRERYDHLIALKRFISETRDVTDLNGLVKNLESMLTIVMQTQRVYVLLLDAQEDAYLPLETSRSKGVPGPSVGRNSIISHWLENKGTVLTPRELEVDPYLQAMADSEKEMLRTCGIELLLAMKSKGELTGILALGPKITEDDFSREDIDLLATVASQAATTLENSRLYHLESMRLKELESLELLKSNLLRTIAHELKSPVTAVRSAVEFLSESEATLTQGHRQRVMRALQSGVDRLERMIQESLDYAQMRGSLLKLDLEQVSMAELIYGAVTLVRPPIEAKKQSLRIDVSPDLSQLYLDRLRFERVLLNLLSNANKFTPSGGELSLRAYREDHQVVIVVSDTGPGIPEDEQEMMFHEYYRGGSPDTQRNGGSGLGLAIAKHLVELHGGSIQLKSKVGKGTSVACTLPVNQVRA